MSQAKLIEFHVLYPQAVGNTNRGMDGAPKTVELGGSTRLRVSSQSFKRALRLSMQSKFPELFAGIRTKHHDERLAVALVSEGCPEEHAGNIASCVMDSLTGGDTLTYLGDNEVQAYATFLAAATAKVPWDKMVVVKEDKKAKKAKDGEEAPASSELAKDLLKGFKAPQLMAADIALFGRMLANATDLNVEAACEFAHAISTNPVEIEQDYFTAVDDRGKTTGAGHIGQNDFSTGIMYMHFNVNLEALARNLPGYTPEMLKQVVMCFAESALFNHAAGKQNTMLSRIEPIYATAIVRSGTQATQVSWDVPVEGDSGFGPESVARLKEELEAKKERFGDRVWGEIARAEYGDKNTLENFLAAIASSI
jgi:CRISPR system Cascade subunit CasC